jgi:hypothetical protein
MGDKGERGERTIIVSANIVHVVFGNGFFGQSGIV